MFVGFILAALPAILLLGLLLLFLLPVALAILLLGLLLLSLLPVALCVLLLGLLVIVFPVLDLILRLLLFGLAVLLLLFLLFLLFLVLLLLLDGIAVAVQSNLFENTASVRVRRLTCRRTW